MHPSWEDIDEVVSNIAFLFLVLFAIVAVLNYLSLWALLSGFGVFLAAGIVAACFLRFLRTRSKRQEDPQKRKGPS